MVWLDIAIDNAEPMGISQDLAAQHTGPRVLAAKADPSAAARGPRPCPWCPSTLRCFLFRVCSHSSWATELVSSSSSSSSSSTTLDSHAPGVSAHRPRVLVLQLCDSTSQQGGGRGPGTQAQRPQLLAPPCLQRQQLDTRTGHGLGAQARQPRAFAFQGPVASTQVMHTCFSSSHSSTPHSGAC